MFLLKIEYFVISSSSFKAFKKIYLIYEAENTTIYTKFLKLFYPIDLMNISILFEKSDACENTNINKQISFLFMVIQKHL